MRHFGVAARWVGLRAHDFRFSVRTASELPSAGWPSGSRLPLFGTHRFGVVLGGLAFGLTASAFRHAPLRSCPRRVDLRAHGFRFSARTASGLPSSGWRFRSAGWPSGSRLPLFGMHRFGVTLGELVLLLGGLVFGLTASAFRHAPLRSCRAADARADGAHRHDTCFTSKHLSQHVNLPHRSP